MNIESGYNYQFIAVGIAVCMVWTWLIICREQKGSAVWWHTVGLFLQEVGVLTRVIYWGIASHQPGEEPCGKFPNWACDYSDGLFFAIQVSVVGMTLMVRPLLMQWFGRYWAVPTVVISVISFYIGAFL